MRAVLEKLLLLPARALAGMVGLYQVLLSPDHSWLATRFPYGYCRHYPSCSEYSRQSLLKFGLPKGLFLSVRRVLHCHPWAEPSVDLVP
jgi:uncharacterized protein